MNSAWFAAGFPNPDAIAAIVVPISFCAIPVIAILTRHQRQMAEIIHGRRRDDILQAELDEVKAKVAALESQLRALDRGSQSSSPAEDLRHRLG